MQHDSIVQIAEAEISKFPSQLTEDMFHEQVSFESILHIPTLTVTDNVPEAFEDFLSSLDCNADNIVKKHPKLQELIGYFQDDENHPTESASLLYRHYNYSDFDFEFLVQVQTSVPRNIKFTSEGNFHSCNTGGFYQLNWIFATDMKNAAEQAIEIAENVFAREEAKARKEQGIEG